MIDNASGDRHAWRQWGAPHPGRVAIHQHDLIVGRALESAQLLYLVAMRAARIESLGRDDIDLLGFQPIEKLTILDVDHMNKNISRVYRLNALQAVDPKKALREQRRRLIDYTREGE